MSRIIETCPQCKTRGPKELVSNESSTRLLALCPICKHTFTPGRKRDSKGLFAIVLLLLLVASVVYYSKLSRWVEAWTTKASQEVQRPIPAKPAQVAAPKTTTVTPASVLFQKVKDAVNETAAELKQMPPDASETATASPYEKATKFVLKVLMAPATARFSELGKDEEAKIETLAPDAWDASGFVDAQNVFSALIRNQWRIVWKGEGDKTEVLYFMFGDEQVGDLESARRAVLPVAKREALELAERQKAEDERKRAEEMKAKEREEYFRQAKEYVAAWIKPPGEIRHSTFGSADDSFTGCKLLGNRVWEAHGVMQYSGTGGRPVRTNWRVFLQAKSNGDSDALYSEFGDRREGDSTEAIRRSRQESLRAGD